MRSHMVLAVSAMLLITTPVRAKDCPATDSGWEAREDAVRKAPSCKAALEVMEACAYVASGDTGLGLIVHERCEPLFLPKLSKAQKRAYDHEQKRCSDKYARQSGTMYRSFTAFCQAQSAVNYARRFGGRAAEAKR
jgi:hypothetical protein